MNALAFIYISQCKTQKRKEGYCMAIGDVFKVKDFKDEIEKLKMDNQRLYDDNCTMQRLLTPEMQDVQRLKAIIFNLETEIQRLKDEQQSTEQEIENRVTSINNLDLEIKSRKKQIIELDDQILLQEFGIYTPVYDLMNSEAYKNKLTAIRQQQKEMIKKDSACRYPTNFTLDGSHSKGKKLVKDNVKQILRSFNNECDAVIDKAKFNNISSIQKKIEKSYEDLNKMNSAMKISIVPKYLSLKLDELNLCYEYAVKKQEEKEEQKRIREQLREEAKLQKEIAEARKNIEKEKTHYKNALQQIESQLSSASESDKSSLEIKKAEVLSHLQDIQKSIEDIDYREANKRAGYVYIISNIGSFGDDVYKIGMTRRLEPTERVDELGDASVPFNFDIHAMIFSDDAPSLENALHKAFEDRKLNMVNQRREFFHVTLDEIEQVVKRNFDKTVEFTRIAPAEQYRESQILRKSLKNSH